MSNTTTPCPDIEELSSWADNESSIDLQEHCDSCLKCREIVEDFKKIDSTMGTLLGAYTPEKILTARILDEIQKPTPVQFNWQRNVIKIAALLVTAFLISQFYPGQQQKGPLVQANTLTVDTQKNKHQAILTEEIDSTLIPSKGFAVIGLSPSNETNISSEVIKDEVKHVWVSTNPQGTAELLERLAFNGVILSKYSTNSGKIEMAISLTDKQLIKVVNHLAEEGNNLISRALPQPNGAPVTTVGTIIQYNVTIIKNN
jgi:hypothetical protein